MHHITKLLIACALLCTISGIESKKKRLTSMVVHGNAVSARDEHCTILEGVLNLVNREINKAIGTPDKFAKKIEEDLKPLRKIFKKAEGEPIELITVSIAIRKVFNIMDSVVLSIKEKKPTAGNVGYVTDPQMLETTLKHFKENAMFLYEKAKIPIVKLMLLGAVELALLVIEVFSFVGPLFIKLFTPTFRGVVSKG